MLLFSGVDLVVVQDVGCCGLEILGGVLFWEMAWKNLLGPMFLTREAWMRQLTSGFPTQKFLVGRRSESEPTLLAPGCLCPLCESLGLVLDVLLAAAVLALRFKSSFFFWGHSAFAADAAACCVFEPSYPVTAGMTTEATQRHLHGSKAERRTRPKC